MRIFITGGCGFIGSNLAEYHLARGDEVHVLDNLSSGTRANVAPFLNNPLFQLSVDDIVTWPDLTKALTWADRVYHLAAVVGVFKAISQPVNIDRTNIIGTYHLFETLVKAKAMPRIILLSSSAVYGKNNDDAQRESSLLTIQLQGHSLSFYAISKIADESIGLAFLKEHGIDLSIVRLFNTVGPRQTGRYGMVIPRFVQQASERTPYTIFGDGTQTRSFCDVRDAIVALDLLGLEPKAIGKIINVGNDHEISIFELSQLINRCIGYENPVNYMSYQEAYGDDFTDTQHRCPDLSLLSELISYKPKWTLEATIRDLIERFENTR